MRDHPPLTPEQWEMIWEAVQYQIGSFEYLSKHDQLWNSISFKRKSELQRLARDIEERLLQ
jgi:hypothetical protein